MASLMEGVRNAVEKLGKPRKHYQRPEVLFHVQIPNEFFIVRYSNERLSPEPLTHEVYLNSASAEGAVLSMDPQQYGQAWIVYTTKDELLRHSIHDSRTRTGHLTNNEIRTVFGCLVAKLAQRTNFVPEAVV